MIVEELKNIISLGQKQRRSGLYIRSLLKEYLQVYVLNYIYLDSLYNKNFIFTGGTCLRQCFDLNRLSEDLDFDLESPIDINLLKDNLLNYFRQTYLYDKLQISVLQKGKQLLLKFPVLRELSLASNSESDLLFVKIDLSPVISPIYEKYTTLKTLYSFNYIVTHYDLPSLMANKIAAIMNRSRFWRDYFDLLWFLEKKVEPNIPRLNDLLKKNFTLRDIVSILDKKVDEAVSTYKLDLQRDLTPFIDNPQLLNGYIEGYKKNYDLKKSYLTS